MSLPDHRDTGTSLAEQVATARLAALLILSGRDRRDLLELLRGRLSPLRHRLGRRIKDLTRSGSVAGPAVDIDLETARRVLSTRPRRVTFVGARRLDDAWEDLVGLVEDLGQLPTTVLTPGGLDGTVLPPAGLGTARVIDVPAGDDLGWCSQLLEFLGVDPPGESVPRSGAQDARPDLLLPPGIVGDNHAESDGRASGALRLTVVLDGAAAARLPAATLDSSGLVLTPIDSGAVGIDGIVARLLDAGTHAVVGGAFGEARRWLLLERVRATRAMTFLDFAEWQDPLERRTSA